MSELATFEQLAPFLSSSPVTVICFVLWWELRTMAKSIQSMGERIAALEAHLEK